MKIKKIEAALLVATLLAACGGGSSSSSACSGNCAPAGTYTMAFVRSATPGDCPTTAQPPSSNINVKANDACGSATLQQQATDSNGCTDTLAFTLTASCSGFSGGKLALTVDCTAKGGNACTANFDVTLTKQ